MSVICIWVIAGAALVMPMFALEGIRLLVEGIRSGEIELPRRSDFARQKKKPARGGNRVQACGGKVRREKYGYIHIIPQTGRDVKGLRVKTRYRK